MTAEPASNRFYDRTAEYVAVLLPAAWTAVAPAVAAALSGLDTATGPVLDVGAGTGIGTALIARALPGARIVAIEPHPGLRTALLARITEHDEFAARVTVLSDPVLSAACHHGSALCSP